MTTLMRKKIRDLLASCMMISVFITPSTATAASAKDPTIPKTESHISYKINSISWEQSSEEYILRVKGNSAPTYTIYELFEPLRVIIDIADASIVSNVLMPNGLPNGPVSEVNGKVITDKEPSIARIELSLRSENSYSAIRANNDILIKFSKNQHAITDIDENKENISEQKSANEIISNLILRNDTAKQSQSQTQDFNTETEPEKPQLTSVLNETDISQNSNQGLGNFFKTPSPPDLTFAGYTKQRITVDFYKIDLHNVFRLFGDISNLNIVVDEAVSGSLTLALNDVPWDFALDIILNLKDLQKEERFNTIVISPKSKSFTWPERALDNIEFKSDIKVQQADSDPGGLKINKRIEVPETIIEAKKIIHQASILERKGEYANALPLYEEAFTKWGDNINLAKKIAAMCLVNLEQNAKAVHYAKSVLKLNPIDGAAALQAAIGLARMQRVSESRVYFEIATSTEKPASEALISYSSFCEEQQNYDCSQSNLKRHEDLYGDNLSTMVSKARIYDKQGKQDQAAIEYQTILLSGFELPPDLANYIRARAALMRH